MLVRLKIPPGVVENFSINGFRALAFNLVIRIRNYFTVIGLKLVFTKTILIHIFVKIL